MTFPNFTRLLRAEHVMYGLILAIIGLILVFLVPPFQSPDEQTHLYRAYQLSEGHIVGKRLSYGAGDTLPSSLSHSFNQFSYLLFNPNAKVGGDRFQQSLTQPLNTHRVTETRFENTAIYPPFAYLPQVVGIWIGKLFSASPVVLLYLARIANLAIWVSILWFIMRRNKRFILPIFAFGLVPIVAFQAASASADVLTTGVALLFTSEVLRAIISQKRLIKRNILLLTGSAVALALCKFPYALLVGLVFIIPARRFSNRKQEWQVKLGILAIVSLLSLAWLIVAEKTFVNLRAGIDESAQLHFILSQPWHYAKVLFQTYVSNPSDTLYLQTVGQLGWLDTKLPLWSILLAWSSILLAIISVPISGARESLLAKQRVWATLVMAATVVTISSSLYITWSAPRAPFVDGLQGRYFMPLFGALLIVGGGLLGLQAKQYARAKHIVYVLSGSVMISTITVLILRYYVG